ncbi:MAG: hypothetical protein ACRED9_07385 [Caulobacteraceae bacterium]
MTITELRRNIFRLVDEALATGEPIVFRRRGRRMILRSEGGESSAAAEHDEERDERWRRFWAAPAEIHEDLSLEEIESAGETYWRWRAGPDPDR